MHEACKEYHAGYSYTMLMLVRYSSSFPQYFINFLEKKFTESQIKMANMRMNQIQNDTQLENLEHQYEFNHIDRINQQEFSRLSRIEHFRNKLF